MQMTIPCVCGVVTIDYNNVIEAHCYVVAKEELVLSRYATEY